MPESKTAGKTTKQNRVAYKDKEKPTEIRFTNINAAKGWEEYNKINVFPVSLCCLGYVKIFYLVVFSGCVCYSDKSWSQRNG
jgi:hypothetical protein